MTGVFRGTSLDVPAGVIVTFDGTGEEVPPGWVYCDGNNGTPDLRDLHPKCVPDGSTDPGATGGSDTHTLTSKELPSHTHAGAGDSEGDHTHEITGYNNTVVTGGSETYGYFSYNGTGSTGTFGGAGAHTHSFGMGDAGGDGSYNHEPAFKTMTFMMKL